MCVSAHIIFTHICGEQDKPEGRERTVRGRRRDC